MVSQWKPIETAPKDGTVIDVWASKPEDWDNEYYVNGSPKTKTCLTEACRCTNVCWDNLEEDWIYITGEVVSELFDCEITHWMPLPEPPDGA